ncbi:exosortase A [Aliiglaciecola sp. LCG003]|uniref:exosortase A n=1 Tax=Aliiglaciecola sp. LCG003 TaxID=3053655 RepID=UPI0025731B88|nr:exosortase A [Aliiglaciecola sp. LCG003]WJG10447.1 exosortase A [Aliiglaciecola sp. LCG003]
MTFLKSSIFKYLVAIFALWAVLFYSSIQSTVAIWYRSETFAHCFIILPICIYLIKLKWAKLNNAQIKPSLLAVLFIAATLFVWLFGSMAQVLVIEQLATFAMLPMLIWCLMGREVARILLFTSFFWMFSVPAGEFLIPQLQELTANITVMAIQLTGIPVYREGLYIAIPGGLFEVAVACSGIRYLIASFTLGTLFAYLNYNGIKKRLIFIAFSIVLPLVANGIRAYGIVMIAHLSDMKYATGVDHLIYGWLFFGVVILVMFTLGGRWADPIPAKVSQVNPNGPKVNFAKLLKPGVVLAIVLVVGFGYKQAFKHQVSNVQPDMAQIFSVQKPIADQRWLPIFHNPTTVISGNQDGTDYYYAYYNANLQDVELINGRNKLYNIETWSIVSDDANERFRMLEIIDNYGNKRLLAYAYVTPWHITHKSLEIKLVQAIQALLGQPQNAFILMISVPVTERDSDFEQLEKQASALFNQDLKALLNDQ